MKNLRSKRGVTVLEVLLAIFVLLIGVTGVLTLFPVGVKLNHDSNDQVMTAMTAQNALAALRAEVGIVERAKGWTSTNTNGDVLNWDGTISHGLDTCGGNVLTVGGSLLDDRVETQYTLAGASVTGTTSVSLSTTVAGPNNGYPDGWNNSTGNKTVELIRFIPNSTPNPVTYTQAGAVMNLTPYVYTGGATAGSFGSNKHGRGSNLYLPGDGETPSSNNGGVGFGAHANWLITFDLQQIRAVHFGGTANQFTLEGRFGMNGQGASGEGVNPGTNKVYGYIFTDGVLALATPGKNTTAPDYASTAINYAIPISTRYLTLAILNGDNSSTYDDGTFRDMNLRITNLTVNWMLNPMLGGGETSTTVDDRAIMLMTSGNAIFKPYRLDRYATLSPSLAASWKPGVSSFPSDGVLSTDTFKLIGARDINHEWLTVPRRFYGDGTTNPSKYTLGKGAADGYGYLVFVNRVSGSETTFAVHILVYKGYDESMPPEANAPPIAYFTTILSDTLLR